MIDAVILRMAAPRIGRSSPLAECMMRFTGMRSASVKCNLARSCGPARQLWHPVSAMASTVRAWVSCVSVLPEVFPAGCDGDFEMGLGLRLPRGPAFGVSVPCLVVEGSLEH